MPRLEQDLGLGLNGQQWVFLSYSLALAALYLVAGAVGDRWGRGDAFMWGIVGFAAASALAGAAGSGGLLIVARALQGVAGAFVTTNSLALLRATYGAEAGRAVGLWTALTGVAMIAGPPVGGALVEWASWRWVFFINLPIAAVALLLARAGRCRETAHGNVGRLDLGGALSIAVGLGLLTFGLVQGPESGFGELWWAFAGAALAFASFAAIELRVSEPMLPLWLFRRRNFLAANLATLLVYAGLGRLLSVLQPVPAVPRLLTVRGGARQPPDGPS